MEQMEALPAPTSDSALPLYKAVEIRNPAASYPWKLMKLVDGEYENYGFYHSQDAAVRVMLRMVSWDQHCEEEEKRRAA